MFIITNNICTESERGLFHYQNINIKKCQKLKLHYSFTTSDSTALRK